MKLTINALIATAALCAVTMHNGAAAAVKSILADDGEGNKNEVAIDDYVAGLVARFEVKPIESETQGKIAPKKAVNYIVTTLIEEKELDESVTSVKALSELIETVTADVAYTKANAVSAADKAKAEKEEKEKAAAAEKERKEKEAAELKLRQDGFISKVNEGATKALGEFAASIEQLKEGLPSTIVITAQGAQIGEGATDADVANSIGYLLGKSHGNDMLNRLLNFTIGDLAEDSVKKGIYSDVSAASKGISKNLEDAKIVTMKPNTITAYRQLAVRTPGELRNPEVDPSAYLAISQVNGNPKKMDGETTEAFEARKTKLAADLRGIQEKLSKGEIKTRKEVLPLVLEVEYENKLKERPSGEQAASPGENLRTYFLAGVALANLVGAQEDAEDDEIQFLGEDGKTIVTVKKQDLELIQQEAYNNLLNIYVKTKKVPATDTLRGYSNVEELVPMGTDGDGKAITEKQIVKKPVYMPIFFKIDTGDSEGEAGTEGSEGSTEGQVADAPTNDGGGTPESEAPAAEAKPATKKAKAKA